ncbi:hypothetical protein LSAT2_020189 [Lamellibrachia satsuma]|nr:hypothetical protein LSAT2_020189 [Lamellibrachia satsuma]
MYVWSVVGLLALVGVADVSGLCWKVCTWQQWEGWSTCSRTCGGGIRRRVRALCGWPWWKEDGRFRRCRKSESDSHQSEYCNTLCFHGVWSAWVGGCRCKDGYRGQCCQQQVMYWSGWSAWSACSVTCSGDGVEGRHVRQRKCLGPSDNNVLRGCTGNAAQLRACRPDVPCQGQTYFNCLFATDPARKTTAAEDTTTEGYDSTRPAYTTEYTTIHQETTEHEVANETGNSTKHMDTTSPSQLQEDTTPLQTTTIPPSDRGETTIPLSDRGETTTGTTVNGTPQLYNYTSVVNSTEYPTDNNRTSHDVNRTAVNSSDTTEKNTPSPTTVASQITSDRNGSMWVATSAAPETVTWTSHTNNDTYYLNGTSYLSSNKTSTGIFNETLYSDSGDDIPFDTQVKTSHSMANNTAKTIHTHHRNTSSRDLKNTNDSSVGNVSRTDSEEITNHPIQNKTSSDFEDIQSDNQVNTSTTENPVESSSEKVTDQLEIKTTPLNLTESSMSLENVSKYNSDDNATVSPLINTSVSILNKPETDILTETTLMNTSSQPTSDEQFTTPTGTFIENTTIPLDIPEGPTVVNVEDTTAMSARETVTQRTFTDAEVIAIEEADHAKAKRREREVVPQHKPDMSSGEANNTDIIHTSASTESDRTTMQMPSSATSQPPDSAEILAEKDTSMTSTENVIPVENFTRDATQTENYNNPVVTQTITVEAFGDHDDAQNATAGPDQTLTELPEKNVSHNRWTDALPETPTIASVPGVISGTTETNMTSEPGNATALRPQQNDTTTRSISLDVPGQTITMEATGPDRRTTVPTTRASPVPTTSPLIQAIWRWDLQFVIQPKNQSVSLGRPVVFECVTEPPSDITW